MGGEFKKKKKKKKKKKTKRVSEGIEARVVYSWPSFITSLTHSSNVLFIDNTLTLPLNPLTTPPYITDQQRLK